MVTSEEYEKYAEFYNKKSLKRSAVILILHIVLTALVLFVSSQPYPILFFIGLVLLIAYLSVEENNVQIGAQTAGTIQSNDNLPKALAIMCFFSWATIIEITIFGVYSSKLIGVYAALSLWGFVGVFSQLPFYTYFTTKRMNIFRFLIWWFRAGVLWYLCLSIYAFAVAEWSVNITNPFS